MTSKTKNIVLVIGTLLALVLSYKFAISNTLALKIKYDDLKDQELLLRNMPKTRSLLKQKQIYYDSILNKYQGDGSSVQNKLLKTINTYADANQLKVLSFLEPHTFVLNDLKTNTYQFTLEGDYDAILKLIHKLEQDTKFGEIVNLHFEKKKNYRSGRYYLHARVLLKSFG